MPADNVTPALDNATTPILSVVDRLPQAVGSRAAVRILEDALAAARSGKVIGVALAMVHASRQAETVVTACDEPLLLLGAVARLKDRISDTIGIEEMIVGSHLDPDSGPDGDAA